MGYFRGFVERLCRDRCAVTALEYALIAGIIVATVLIGFNTLSNALSNQFSNIGGSL
ncbi:MAG TPA: Flp family type IVb pilin [Acetobacteraceae bacterium]|jgi:Flp pilus assembly pilin Flp|nr:Flp family type IVb pilin [Acetobacteraceae bacterium]